MAANTARNTISRQWELLKLLPARAPGCSASELVQRLADAGFNVSKRTVERDLNELSLLFPLQCNDRGTPWGWHWAPGASAELPGLTLNEALTLRLAEEHLHALLPGFMLDSLQPRFNQARQKLAALEDSQPLARWSRRIASVSPEMNLLAPATDPAIVDTLHQALLGEQQLDVLYRSAGNTEGKSLQLNPLGLIQRGKVTYLAAIAEPWEDVRIYAVHRFRRAVLLDSPLRQPADFSLEGWIAGGAMQFISPGAGSINLQALIHPDLARQLGETALASDMLLQPAADSWYRLTATVQDSWQLRWWLLSRTGQMLLEQPQALRDEITTTLQDGLALYQKAAKP